MTTLPKSFKIGLLLMFLRILTATAKPGLKEAPCKFSDTLPLDPSQRLENGSYSYDGIIVPAGMTGYYDYDIVFGEVKQTDTHLRGCVCQIKTCIDLCCPLGYEFTNGTCQNTDLDPDTFINITKKDGAVVLSDVAEVFALKISRPCKDLFYYTPEENEYLQYSILENGSLLQTKENRIHERDQFCLSPRILNYEFFYTPLQCYLKNPVDIADLKLNGIALSISVPFMILTIIVHLYLPNLRTIHGYSLCCYLGGLIVGYSSLAFLIFESDISSLLCSILGYVTYYGFMSAFFWLSAISYDLFNNFHGKKSNQQMKHFRLYCLYAFGLAFVCLICTFTAQNSSLPKSWKSGIGSDDSCFVNALYGWGAWIYFYGPLLVILLFNTVMFIRTFINIRNCYQQCSKPHQEHKNLCVTFVQLFILMGITWLAELAGYALSGHDGSLLYYVFRLADLLNACQGVIIFILFVCKKSVRRQIVQKIKNSGENPSELSQEMTECL